VASLAEPKLAYSFQPPGDDFFISVSTSVAMAGTLELMKCSVGTDQKENIDL
jgi:hypothetical protein